jgi:ATP-dependent DNA ligase
MSQPAKKGTQKSAKSTTAIGKTSEGFTDEERVAMKERLQELKAAARRGPRAETLVRDARVCQGRQGRLLLPKRV